MLSETIYTPYFYIIRHIKSQKMYAGSRYAKGCDPLEFMKPNGYTTSSKIVNAIIKKEGVNAFEILRIDTFCDNCKVNLYEQSFLEINNCAASDIWFNNHNGMGISDWLNCNNINCAYQLEECKLKAKQTKLIKYNDENYNNSKKASKTRANTLNTRYGVDNVMQIPEVANKSIKTRCKNNLQKYGVEHINSLPNIKENISNSVKATNQERYGVNGYVQTEEFSLKSKKTLQEKYGVDHNSKIPHVKEAKKQYLLTTYGVENPSQIKFLSIIETKKTYPKSAISRYFPYFKQFY